MQRAVAKRLRVGVEGREEGKEATICFRERLSNCGEMEAPTNQPQSGDLLKTVIKVMEGPKTLTIRKIGEWGIHAVLWGDRGFKLFLSLPLFFYFYQPARSMARSFPCSLLLTLQPGHLHRSIFSLISDNMKPSQRRFSTVCTHSSSGASERTPRRFAACSRVIERDTEDCWMCTVQMGLSADYPTEEMGSAEPSAY